MRKYGGASKLAQELFGALKMRDVQTAAGIISDNAVWSFPGRRGALAGRREGREAIFRFLFQASALTEGAFHAEIIEIVGNDDVAFVISSERRGGAKSDLRMKLASTLNLKAAS